MADRLQLLDLKKKRIGPQGEEIEILRGITLEPPPGRLTVVIGPSGGGKSTLVRLVNRLEDPDGGRVLLNGEDIADIDPLQLRRRVGLVAQKPFMFEGTVLENLQRPYRYGRQPAPAADSPEILEVLRLCQVEPQLLPRQARSLSLGQQQRASLARALLARPSVLLLDEPTSALDRPTGDRLGDTLREICPEADLTLLMVTHDLRLAQRAADYAAYLEGGRILEAAAAEELFSQPRSPQLRAFLTLPEREGPEGFFGTAKEED